MAWPWLAGLWLAMDGLVQNPKGYHAATAKNSLGLKQLIRFVVHVRVWVTWVHVPAKIQFNFPEFCKIIVSL